MERALDIPTRWEQIQTVLICIGVVIALVGWVIWELLPLFGLLFMSAGLLPGGDR